MSSATQPIKFLLALVGNDIIRRAGLKKKKKKGALMLLILHFPHASQGPFQLCSTPETAKLV